ncbi:RAMP superfamily CRISPR-associated protein [Nonomuraea sp. B1E8]|uniref:RAMP superfamily CRISPR-associated protein n=1 Tax=unclassified Nonomuraea TaxID=2593643 RepID=UPI00325E8BAC
MELRLRMLSDWHIGTGTAARGRAARLVQRDVDGLPYVPAKTLVGVWRDACEVAARALGDSWSPWVEYLFGSQRAHYESEDSKPPHAGMTSPRPAALLMNGPLRVPGRLGEVLATRPRLREAVTFVKPGVALDPRTRTAVQRKFRYEEMARGGMTLAGSAELADELDGDQLACALALLWAGAMLVESIGGKRRRGAGRCQLTLSGPGMPPDIDRLSRPPAGPPGRVGPESAREAETRAGEGWERALLTLRLLDPLLAHDRTVGNLTIGLDHVPGWNLFPEVLKRLKSAGAAARRGDLIVSAATLLVDGRRTLPAPRVLARSKDEPDLVVNRMTSSGDSGQPLKRLRGGYVGNGLRIHRPGFITMMHNTINDATQRPTRDLGGVYVYTALEAGTELAAEVRVRAGLLPEGWQKSLAGTWRLGRSQKDDYGRASVTVQPEPITPATGSPLREGDLLRIWLLSDILVLDSRLSFSSDPADLGRALTEAFAAAGAPGVRVEPVLEDEDRVPTSYEVRRTESWHRKWGLPRPTLLGPAAGGCVTFRVTAGQISPDALAEVELAGVGMRRGEGFGQVRFNDPLLINQARNFAVSSVPAPPTAAQPLAPGDAGYDDARIIERAAWRGEIRRSAERLAAASDVLADLKGLSISRLNNIRNLLSRLREDPEVLRRRIGRLTARWPGSSKAQKVLEERLLSENWVWRTLNLPEGDLCLTVDAVHKLRTELRAEAISTLLIACLAARARREAAGDEEQEARP